MRGWPLLLSVAACVPAESQQTSAALAEDPVTLAFVVRGQPEHLRYVLSSTASAPWSVEVRRAEGARCAELLDRRAGTGTIAAASVFGLAPGQRYCVEARSGRHERRALATLPSFEARASVVASPADARFEVATSTFARGAITYAEGACAELDPPALDFLPWSRATLVGPILDPRAFTLALGVRPAAERLDGALLEAEGGALRIALDEGRVHVRMRGAREVRLGAPLPLAAETWARLVLSYDEAALRLYVDGVLRASAPATGALNTVAGGGATLGGGATTCGIGS